VTGRRIEVLLGLAGTLSCLGKPASHRRVNIECRQAGLRHGGRMPGRKAFLLII
jgi:hypothetical protein